MRYTQKPRPIIQCHLTAEVAGAYIDQLNDLLDELAKLPVGRIVLEQGFYREECRLEEFVVTVRSSQWGRSLFHRIKPKDLDRPSWPDTKAEIVGRIAKMLESGPGGWC